ncbi:Uncharacterised protein [Chlamydia trachomatis]|nr:Uncharacterised protein [Chlamydia trachomatis]
MNVAFVNFSSNSLFSSSEIHSRILSTRLIVSPIPRIRSAIDCALKGRRSFIFSPHPSNLIGLLSKDFTDNTAPARASPSAIDTTTPVKPKRSSKAFAVTTASCPIAKFITNKVSHGLVTRAIATNSSINASST